MKDDQTGKSNRRRLLFVSRCLFSEHDISNEKSLFDEKSSGIDTSDDETSISRHCALDAYDRSNSDFNNSIWSLLASPFSTVNGASVNRNNLANWDRLRKRATPLNCIEEKEMVNSHVLPRKLSLDMNGSEDHLLEIKHARKRHADHSFVISHRAKISKVDGSPSVPRACTFFQETKNDTKLFNGIIVLNKKQPQMLQKPRPEARLEDRQYSVCAKRDSSNMINEYRNATFIGNNGNNTVRGVKRSWELSTNGAGIENQQEMDTSRKRR